MISKPLALAFPLKGSQLIEASAGTVICSHISTHSA